MPAVVPVQIPGFGQAVAGLDWLVLPGLDGKGTEVKQLGRGVNAAWQYIWTVKNKEDEYVAFVSKGEIKERPVAAAVLVRAAIQDETYLALVDVGEARLWIFAVKDSMPVSRMDRVAEAADLRGLVRDFLTSLPDPSKVPIYTDRPALLEKLPFGLDVRPFSLEILGHSLKKRDFSKAAFSRHTSVSTGGILIGVVLASMAGGYYLYQLQAEATARSDAMQIRQREITKRKSELASAVNTAINSAAPARVIVPIYLDALRRSPLLVSGWRLSDVVCQGQGCTLTYKGQAFATWNGYMKAKPSDWLAPKLDADIQKIVQPLPVLLPSITPRTPSELPTRDKVQLDLGNLAQVSKQVGLTITPQNSWERVAGQSGTVDDQWVPLKSSFSATGSAVLLNDLAARLPEVAGMTHVFIKVDEKITFEMKGQVYANP